MDSTIGSELLEGMQEFSETLKDDAVISDEFNCRKVVLKLRPEPYDPQMVKEARRILGASQGVFAQFLGVSTKTVQGWEQGLNQPKKVSCRIMDEIRRDPPYWRRRLKESVESCESSR